MILLLERCLVLIMGCVICIKERMIMLLEGLKSRLNSLGERSENTKILICKVIIDLCKGNCDFYFGNNFS